MVEQIEPLILSPSFVVILVVACLSVFCFFFFDIILSDKTLFLNNERRANSLGNSDDLRLEANFRRANDFYRGESISDRRAFEARSSTRRAGELWREDARDVSFKKRYG